MKPVKFLEQAREVGIRKAAKPRFLGAGVVDGPEDVEGVVIKIDEKGQSASIPPVRGE
jgi:hypothetical protein